MINLENIPQGILDELDSFFKIVAYSNYGQPATPQCSSRKLNYKEITHENTTIKMCDPSTFDVSEVFGDMAETFMVRGIFTESSIDVFAIYSSGIVAIPK